MAPANTVEVLVHDNEESAFSVLADQVRRQILDVLAENGECSAGFISDRITSVGRTTVSAHLKALRLSGMVIERRDGRHRYFSIDPAGPTQDALAFLQSLLNGALATSTEQPHAPESSTPPASGRTA
ncbi:helix-turn-helix transcriptional regulator [Gordonia sp. OPL2]|uniref:ArsR/SmtB family transcription factor n=1 Tax=Gordonia sp. OPL2 TaxID=2486274 RepID=UPI00165587EC|nr:winged helix-turn-helix domain-containing protein [Gordonia sp. OPL2]RPA19874.1 ArsR family transcriptional regulator [Gordonia sp. OPL2]